MGITSFLNKSQSTENIVTELPYHVKEMLSKETGRERIIRMYTVDEFGYSPEMIYIIKTGMTSVVLAGFYGGIKGMINENTEYLRKNVATTYESQHLARRGLTDRMTLAGFHGAAKYGLQYGGFTSLYLLSTLTIANYRNKMTPFEHAASAAVVGALARINFGLKGMLVAGALGGTLGLFAGIVVTVSMKLSGVTMEDLRCWQHEDHILRRRKLDKKKDDSS